MTVRRETIVISGDRPLYLYTFELDGEPMPEMQAKDTEPATQAEG